MSWRLRFSHKAMQPTTKTNPSTVINRISGYNFRRKFSKPPIGTSEKFRPIVPVTNHQQPRKFIGENVVPLRRTRWAPEMSLYRAYFVPGAMDSNETLKRICDHFMSAMGSGAGMHVQHTSIEFCEGDCSSLNSGGGFSNAGGQGGFSKRCRPFVPTVSPPTPLTPPYSSGVNSTSWESETGEWSDWVLVGERNTTLGGSYCTYQNSRKTTYTATEVYKIRKWIWVQVPGTDDFPVYVLSLDWDVKTRETTRVVVQTQTATDAVCGECPESRPSDHDFDNK